MLLVALCQLPSPAGAETPAEHGFLRRVVDGRRYVVFVPDGPAPDRGWPLILFLHSAGERGTDGSKQLDYGLGPAIRQRAATFEGIVVFPQADFAEGPILETWRAGEPAGQLARAAVHDVEQNWPVDPDRRAIAGWSMGAYGALSLAADDPGYFSKVLAVSGGGEPEWGAALSSLPVWLIHGEEDTIVPASESRELVEAISAGHDRLQYTEVAAAGHDVWRSVFDDDGVLQWLLDPDAPSPPQLTIDPSADRLLTEKEESKKPFVPALIISRAISLRLGNDALATLAAGVPRSMEDQGLRGRLEPVEDEVDFDGERFSVRFGDLSYRTALHRAILGGRDGDRLHIAFALRDFTVNIGTIDVEGRRDSVHAGPVSVVIGHREPVWLKLDVRPLQSAEGGLRLQLLESDFAIPDHNWYVSRPDQIDIRGDLFQPDVVTTAIVGGIYQRKATIERQILGAAPSILQQVEDRVDFSPLDQLITRLWPLPVYEPRVQVLLEEVAADARGVSLVFGCAVARPDGQAGDQEPRRVRASAPSVTALEQTSDLRAAVAVDVMQHLSALVAGSKAVTLFAADVPGRPFEELDTTRSVVSVLRPTSPGVGDVRSRFSLKEPFSYVPLREENPDTGSVGLAIDIPHLSLTVFGLEDGQSELISADQRWVPLSSCALTLRQPLLLTVRPELDGPTRLTIDWGDGGHVDCRDDFDGDPRARELVPLFEQGWSRWTHTQKQIGAVVPDVAVGSSALRLERFVWKDNCLTASFQPAATVLVNRSSRPVSYCVRSEASRWSRELTLEAGHRHVYRTGATMEIRPADRWSRTGQPLAPAVYDWSATTNERGFHWIRRDRSRQQPVSTATAR